MKAVVHIAIGVALLCLAVVLVCFHMLTKAANRSRTEKARENRWPDKKENEVENAGNPEFKTPINGQHVTVPQS